MDAVHLVQPLGPGVPGLEIVVAQRPGRRHAVGVFQLAEILGAQPVQRGLVQFRGAADEVVHLRLERLAVGVVPGIGEMYFPSTKTAPGFQLSVSRGRKSPRSSSNIRLPDGASVWASVPPPAPLPTIITS
jgi:hypothetical protein